MTAKLSMICSKQNIMLSKTKIFLSLKSLCRELLCWIKEQLYTRLSDTQRLLQKSFLCFDHDADLFFGTAHEKRTAFAILS